LIIDLHLPILSQLPSIYIHKLFLHVLITNWLHYPWYCFCKDCENSSVGVQFFMIVYRWDLGRDCQWTTTGWLVVKLVLEMHWQMVLVIGQVKQSLSAK